MIAQSLRKPRHQRLGFRLLARILAASAALGLLITFLQVGMEYRHERRALQGLFVLIQAGHLGPIEHGLRNGDTRQVQVQLEAMLALPDLRFAEVRAHTGERLSVGALPPGAHRVERELPLRHGQISLGHLRLVATTQGLWLRLLGRAGLALAASFAAMAALSGMLLLLFHRMVTRHLETLAAEARGLDLQHLDRPFRLDRPRPAGMDDELDDVVGALEDMRESLRAEFVERERAWAELATLNERLQVAKEAAEAASRAKDHFLANMGHELKTPLNHVVLYAELLEEEIRALGHEELVPDLQKIRQAGHHLAGILTDLLEMARLEAGRATVHPEGVDLEAFLQEVVHAIRPLADAGGNAFKVSQDPHPGWIRTDAAKLRQILLHLLENACRLTEGGIVGLEMRLEEGPEGRVVRFTVRDSGPGIPEARLDQLFVPFAPMEEGLGPMGERAGLGLALSHGLCVLLGGTLAVASRPGEGTAFTVTLPAPVAAPGGGTNEGRARRLLVVDDDAFFRDGIVRSLDREGFAVESAADGESALHLARAHRPDVITLDLMMPGLDGWQVLERLKADPVLATIPVLILTALDLDPEQHRRLRGRAEAVLRKGLFAKDELVRLVHGLVIASVSATSKD